MSVGFGFLGGGALTFLGGAFGAVAAAQKTIDEQQPPQIPPGQ